MAHIDYNLSYCKEAFQWKSHSLCLVRRRECLQSRFVISRLNEER